MARKTNILGCTFGHWTVVAESTNSKKNSARWLCVCDCGNTSTVEACSLKSGASSGCLSCRHKLPTGTSAFNKLFYTYKYGAKRRSIPWELTKDRFQTLTQSRCFYTNREPSSVIKTEGGTYVFNGVDRLDNSKGYTIENSVPCCGRVNEMKMASSFEDFINDCRVITQHFDKKAA